MNKEELRALYRQIRLGMSQADVSTKSRIIGRRMLNEVEWQNYHKICVFKPIARLNEVDITGVVDRLKAQDKKVMVLDSSKNAAASARQFDLIIVPCLAFDKDNYRLGWGGGFYDRFLAAQPRALKIGVCFANGQVENGLPHQSYDIAMDLVITD